MSDSPEGHEPGVRLKLAAMTVCLIGAVGAGALAMWFVHLSEDTPSANFTVPSPQMILLTNQPSASVVYNIGYYQGSFTEPGETQFSAPDSIAPTGTRDMTFTFHVKPGVHLLKFAVLLNSDASMTDATQTQGLGYLDDTVPTGLGEIESPCASVQSFDTAQVLSGVANVDSTGEAIVDIVGGIPNYVQYPSNGDRTPVNVIQMLPNAGDTAAGTCAANLVNWEQVGGVAWQTPTYLSGQVMIGSVPAGRYIESSNPAVVDAQTLEWDMEGPADVSYTLFDSDVESSHEIWLFWAGIAAAFGATLVVEVIKGSAETFSLLHKRYVKRRKPESQVRVSISTSNAIQADVVNGEAQAPVSSMTAFIVGVLSGIAFSKRHPRRRNS